MLGSGSRRDRPGCGLRRAPAEAAARRRPAGGVLRRDLPRQHRPVPRGHRRLRPGHRPQAPRAPVLPAGARALGPVRRRLAAPQPARLARRPPVSRRGGGGVGRDGACVRGAPGDGATGALPSAECCSRTGSSPWSSATAPPACWSSRCCASSPPAGLTSPGRPASRTWFDGRRHRAASCPTGSASRPSRRCCGSRTAPRSPGWSAGGGSSGRTLTGVDGLGPGLPEHRPGLRLAGGRPLPVDALEARYGGTRPGAAARVELADARGRARGDVRPRLDRRAARRPADRGAGAARCCAAPTRDPDDVVAVVPPDLVECTVEKVAVNAVHGRLPAGAPAGRARRPGGRLHRGVRPARPAGHHLLLRPGVVVNGPVARRIGMNSGVNALGPGQPRQRDHRPGAAAGGAQRRRGPPGRGRPGDAGQPRQVHLLLRRAGGRTARSRRWPPTAGCPGDAVTLFAGAGVTAGRRPAQPRPGVAGPHVRRLPAGQRAPEAADGLRRDAGRLTGARPGVPRGRLGPRPAARRAGRSCSPCPPTSWSAAPAAWPRACPPGSAGHDAAQVPARRAARGARRRRRRAVQRVIGGWVSGETGSAPVTREVRA